MKGLLITIANGKQIYVRIPTWTSIHVSLKHTLTNLTSIMRTLPHRNIIQNNIEKPTRCNNNNLLISKISSTCFGQSFAHLQERKTEIYSMWYSVLV